LSEDLCQSCARKLPDGTCDFAADIIYADQRPDVACPAYIEIRDSESITYESYKCPVCNRPLRNTGLGELETEIERRENVPVVKADLERLTKSKYSLTVTVSPQGKKEA